MIGPGSTPFGGFKGWLGALPCQEFAAALREVDIRFVVLWQAAESRAQQEIPTFYYKLDETERIEVVRRFFKRVTGHWYNDRDVLRHARTCNIPVTQAEVKV